MNIFIEVMEYVYKHVFVFTVGVIFALCLALGIQTARVNRYIGQYNAQTEMQLKYERATSEKLADYELLKRDVESNKYVEVVKRILRSGCVIRDINLSIEPDYEFGGDGYLLHEPQTGKGKIGYD